MDATSQTDPSLIYADLLHQLHDLIAAGRGESAEADVLAARMDAAWHAMGDEDRESIRGICRMLYGWEGPQLSQSGTVEPKGWQCP